MKNEEDRDILHEIVTDLIREEFLDGDLCPFHMGPEMGEDCLRSTEPKVGECAEGVKCVAYRIMKAVSNKKSKGVPWS